MSHNKTRKKERCPLCEKHCPLGAPRCRKGEKYAQKISDEAAAPLELRQEPHPMGPDEALLMQLRLCSRCLFRDTRYGGSRYRILALLHERGKIGQQEMQSLLGIKPGSLSELLAKLEKKGLIQRKKNDVDKRNRDIVLTVAGQAWLRDHTNSGQNAQPVFEALSAEEKDQLSALLDKLLKAGAKGQTGGADSAEETKTEEAGNNGARQEDGSPVLHDEPSQKVESTPEAASRDDDSPTDGSGDHPDAGETVGENDEIIPG